MRKCQSLASRGQHPKFAMFEEDLRLSFASLAGPVRMHLSAGQLLLCLQEMRLVMPLRCLGENEEGNQGSAYVDWSFGFLGTWF